MPMSGPPLLGDGHGNYRVYIIGNSGTGKSTLGTYLSAKLNVPHTPLDAIAWKPGWQRREIDEFREKISALMAQNTRGWIIDGNYRLLGTLIPDNATDIIWLDPPLRHYYPRLVWRTILRILGLRSTCAEGCKENWGEVFSSQGIVRYSMKDHAITRSRYQPWLSEMSIESGGKMRRLDESRGELTRWKVDLEEHLRRM